MAARRTDGPKAAKPQSQACAEIGCPYADGGDARCADCPGPSFFKSTRPCHKCQFDGKGDARCAVCAGPCDEPNHKGASHVYLDGLEQGASDALLEKALTDGKECDGEADAESEADAAADEAARRVIAFFAALDVGDFAIVKHLLSGGNLNTYALVNNRTRQDVWKQAKRMMERLPEIRAIVRERKQPNGRARSHGAKARAFQMTLF